MNEWLNHYEGDCRTAPATQCLLNIRAMREYWKEGWITITTNLQWPHKNIPSYPCLTPDSLLSLAPSFTAFPPIPESPTQFPVVRQQ